MNNSYCKTKAELSFFLEKEKSYPHNSTKWNQKNVRFFNVSRIGKLEKCKSGSKSD